MRVTYGRRPIPLNDPQPDPLKSFDDFGAFVDWNYKYNRDRGRDYSEKVENGLIKVGPPVRATREWGRP